MNTLTYLSNQKAWKELALLKKVTDKKRKSALEIRLKKEPYINDLEYLLGAFIEMYEPHLKEIIYSFSEKGYAIDPSSGFAGKYSEYQSINGYISINYITRNKLEKINVKLRESDGFKSLIFWPEKADIEYIKDQWMKIIDLLPDNGVLASPANSFETNEFRRKYVPKDPILQKLRLFERLQYNIRKKIMNETKNRKIKNCKPTLLELNLGIFTEELETQVRSAVLALNKKGYSTDSSGFVEGNPCNQMIEGDFQLDEDTICNLNKENITVETNLSGYTSLQFSPPEADCKKIKKQWDKIISLIPNKKRVADSSMTRKSREFRLQY